MIPEEVLLLMRVRYDREHPDNSPGNMPGG
jgi:hypothetical protein